MPPARLVRRVLPPALALILLAGYMGFVVGRHHPSAEVRHARATSTATSITVPLDGRTFHIPTDVAWVDAQGRFHSHGRPDCLPVASGTIAVTFSTATVSDASGSDHTETLWVDCDK